MYLERVKTLWRLRLLAVPPLGKLIAVTNFIAGDKGADRLRRDPIPSLGPSDLEIRPPEPRVLPPPVDVQDGSTAMPAAQPLLRWAEVRIASVINQPTNQDFFRTKVYILKNN